MNFDKPWSHGRSLDSKGAKKRWTARGEEVEPKSLGDVMSRLLAGTPLGGKIALSDPATRAGMERAWGAGIAARCQPVALEKGVLSLRVKEAAWRYELGFRKGQLVEGLRKECPMLGVVDLRFVP